MTLPLSESSVVMEGDMCMARFSLYQEIMKNGSEIIPGMEQWYEENSSLMGRGFKDAVLVDSQAVYDWTPFKSMTDIGVHEIPSFPPHTKMWFEFRMGEEGEHTEVGALVTVSAPDEVFVRVFFSLPDGNVLCPPVYGVIQYNEDGRVQKPGVNVAVASELFLAEGVDPESVEAIVTTVRWGTCNAILSCMFCHCKNVDLVERLPKRHEQRAAKRAGQPILKYSEIVIDPNRSHATNESSASGDNKPSRSLHLIRGHFAHYTEERKLFGKYAGTFWVPAHVRGRADNGVVKSTYKMKAPAA